MIFRLERGFVMAQVNVVLVKGAKVQKKKNRNSIERKKERTAYLFIALPCCTLWLSEFCQPFSLSF